MANENVAQSVVDCFYQFNKKYEGEVPWMYLDIKGLVTTAIGVLIDPIDLAYDLPFIHRVWGDPATIVEIREEWLFIKGNRALARLGHKEAEKFCQLRLTPEGMKQAVNKKMLQMVNPYLIRRYWDFDTWPPAAQAAILSRSWGAGPLAPAPKMDAHLAKRDFLAAAEEVKLDETGNPGLRPRNVANKLLLQYAQESENGCNDPDNFMSVVP